MFFCVLSLCVCTPSFSSFSSFSSSSSHSPSFPHLIFISIFLFLFLSLSTLHPLLRPTYIETSLKTALTNLLSPLRVLPSRPLLYLHLLSLFIFTLHPFLRASPSSSIRRTWPENCAHKSSSIFPLFLVLSPLPSRSLLSFFFISIFFLYSFLCFTLHSIYITSTT